MARALLLALALLFAVDALADTAEDVAALGKALSDRDAQVRRKAASGLWKLKADAAPAKAQLLRALDDPDLEVVTAAAGALQSLGMTDAQLGPARQRVFSSPEASIGARFEVGRDLVGIEPAGRIGAAIIAFLDDYVHPAATGAITPAAARNADLAAKAFAKLIGRTQDRSLIAPMVEALDARRGSAVVLVQSLALFKPRPEGWAGILARQLDAPNPRVREAALQQLRGVKAEADIAAVVPPVTRLLDDPDFHVRAEALWVLRDAGGLAQSALPRIEKMLADPELQGIAKDTIAAIRAAEPNFAAASPAQAGGKALLRSRKLAFDEGSFVTALAQVDVEAVRAFLDAGMSPKASVAGMGPPMRAMLFAGAACAPRERPTNPATLQAVKLLLERGADPNGADPRGNTALMEAAGKGCDREVVRTLIRAGARVDAKNAAGMTPFELGLFTGGDGLEEIVAAGYRLPPEKARMYADGYKDNPAALALIRKATARK